MKMGLKAKERHCEEPAGRRSNTIRRFLGLLRSFGARNDVQVIVLALAFLFCVPSFADEPAVQHVIIISFDGLRPDAITTLGPKGAPHFYQAMKQGASTLNARSDADWAVTMPNHASMLTGRGANGPDGHNYTDNRSTERSLHETKGSYVSSIFDVAKAHHLTTGFFASKSKFKVFLNSYSKAIDVSSVVNYEDNETLRQFMDQAGKNLPNLTFIHFSDPDRTGHREGWNLKKDSPYMQAVRRDDEHLGRIMDIVRQSPVYLKSTVIMITSDHGGHGLDHGDMRYVEDYRVPLIIWGKGVAAGSDLYRINVDIREDPKGRQVSYQEAGQPIRNGDVANAALKLLGLPVVDGSTIGNEAPIRVSPKK